MVLAVVAQMLVEKVVCGREVDGDLLAQIEESLDEYIRVWRLEAQEVDGEGFAEDSGQ